MRHETFSDGAISDSVPVVQRAPVPPWIFSGVLLPIGAYLLVGGAWLVLLGGSFYYLIAGGLVLASAVLLLRRRVLGAHLYGLMLVVTAIWSAWEAGFDLWSLATRLLGPLVLGGWLLLPVTRRNLHGPGLVNVSSGPMLVGSSVLVTIAGMALAAAMHPQPLDPAYRVRAATLPPIAVSTDESAADGDWAHYGGSQGGARYSGLKEITPQNAQNLQIAWTYTLPYSGPGSYYRDEATPLKIKDKLFLCAANNVIVALDAETGKEIWKFDPAADLSNTSQKMCRGVAYYQKPNVSGDCAERILTNTLDARLVAIDANTGQRCAGFGQNGEISLKDGLGLVKPGFYTPTSAPTIVQGRVVVGSGVTDNAELGEPSGVVRAFDAVTGKLAWAWDMGRLDRQSAPPPGETYTRGTPNAWGPFSADEELGLVYVPTGNATPDMFGAPRDPAWEKYGSAIVAIDVATGRARWSFQTVHHDLWDYDIGAQPSLVDLRTLHGVKPALIAATKQGEIFVLDRRDGQTLSRVEERPTPQGAAPGDWTSPTQPFSVDMPSFAGPDLDEAHMWGLTPLDQLMCRIMFRQDRYEGLFTPPSLQGSLEYPGYSGGVDWGGVSIDQSRQIMVVNSARLAQRVKLYRREDRDQIPAREEPFISEQANTPYLVTIQPFWTPIHVPCQAPPFGMISAVDLRTGGILWSHPLGTAKDSGPERLKLPLPIEMGSTPNVGGSIMTGGGVVFIGASTDRFFRAIDSVTGKEIWRTQLPAGGQATPMSYRAPRSGRQMVAIVSGAAYGSNTDPVSLKVIAYSLPSDGKTGSTK